jgi:glucose-specific phosphotransferase system IIA component
VTISIISPCPGRVMAMADIPDPVFATGMVGLGVGIDPAPEQTTVVSPIAGKVIKMHPHAFVVLGADGTGVLVHLGINTVRLEGAGFEVHVEEGAQVDAGTKMVTWNPAEIPGDDMSPVVPVVVMDVKDATVDAADGSRVETGELLFTLTR